MKKFFSFSPGRKKFAMNSTTTISPRTRKTPYPNPSSTIQPLHEHVNSLPRPPSHSFACLSSTHRSENHRLSITSRCHPHRPQRWSGGKSRRSANPKRFLPDEKIPRTRRLRANPPHHHSQLLRLVRLQRHQCHRKARPDRILQRQKSIQNAGNV